MATLICLGCSAAYAVGAPRCPQCGADDPVADHEATVEQVRALIAATPAAAVKSEHGPEPAASPPGGRASPKDPPPASAAIAGA